MKNIKAFCKDHKKELVWTGLVIGGVIVTAIITKRVNMKNLIDPAGKNVLVWKTPNDSMTLEKVKELLDANANNTSMFAIFREGLDPNAFVCIPISDDVVKV